MSDQGQSSSAGKQPVDWNWGKKRYGSIGMHDQLLAVKLGVCESRRLRDGSDVSPQFSERKPNEWPWFPQPICN